jgi:response regulator NasT
MTPPENPAPRRRRALIVEDDSLVGIWLRAQLEKLGHEVVGEAYTAMDAATLYLGMQPDVVLMDIRLDRMDGIDGIELARQLLQQRRCPMVILSAFSENEMIERASAAGVFGYLIKPVSIQSLQAAIEVAISRFEEHEKVLGEKAELAVLLETRKLVERAKGIFMKRLGLDEAEAHRRLQMESQKRRVSLAELAKKIIESEEILGNP